MPIYKPGSSEAISLITRAQGTTDLRAAVDNAVLRVHFTNDRTLYPWCGITGEGSGTPVEFNDHYMGWSSDNHTSSPSRSLRYQFIRHDVHLSNVTEHYEEMFEKVCAGHIYEVTPSRQLFMAVSFTAVDCNPTFGVAFYRYGDDYKIVNINGVDTVVRDSYPNVNDPSGPYILSVSHYSGTGFYPISTSNDFAFGSITIPNFSIYPNDYDIFWGPMLTFNNQQGQVYIHKLIGTMV